MGKLFDRIITFHVQGEIYDKDKEETTPESIINNYTWLPKDINGEIHLVGHHKDNKGRINRMTKLPQVDLYHQPHEELLV